MADESETAVKPPAPPLPQMMEGNGNGHEHCSDCENEEDNSYNRGGLSPANDTGAKKKKKKQKKKKEKGSEADSAQDQPVKMNSLPAERIQEIQKAIELFSVGQGPAKTMEEASKRSYQFWDAQPVPKLGEVVNTHGPVEPDKDNIRQEPYTLPQGFTWDTLDLGDRGVLKELYTLLNENYVEDDDNMFRFDYSPEFLLWALRPPGWLPQWHCGVRVVSSRKLVGFISAIPANIHIYDIEKKVVEINFLCVHKKLRSKRVAPVLIREITRRVHLEGIFQAVYTAGVVLPKPVGTCRYWHRSLNPRKLIEVKFSHLSRNMTMQRTMKLYRLPEASGALGQWAGAREAEESLAQEQGFAGEGRGGYEMSLYELPCRNETPKTAGLRPMEKKDIPVVHQLLTRYLKQFHLTPVMSQEEVEHWFYPQENIIDTFVVEVEVMQSRHQGPSLGEYEPQDVPGDVQAWKECDRFSLESGSDYPPESVLKWHWLLYFLFPAYPNANGEVTDFLSFYTLPSTIMNHPTHKSLKAAYSFYNVHTQTPLLDLMSDALVLAKMKGFDVFNALDLMENKTFLEKLKFGVGDGNLQYYLYNWKCPSMGAEKVRWAGVTVISRQ
ncbi:hypothetical protein MC885_020503 [Smutsia gigantea]|nr:hypothetical protein MC885_020503 [Smutsia gigantea]